MNTVNKKTLFFKLITLDLGYNHNIFETKTGLFFSASDTYTSLYFFNFHFFWQNFKNVEVILIKNFILNFSVVFVYTGLNKNLQFTVGALARKCFEYWINTPEGLSNLSNKSIKFWNNSMYRVNYKILKDFLPYKLPGTVIYRVKNLLKFYNLHDTLNYFKI
jgi:hypothetical protein